MRIALVDDSSEALAALAGTLREYASRQGLRFDLEAFSSGEELLGGYLPRRYAVIFLDVYMSGMSGIAAAEKIRMLDEDVCLIFLTTSDEHQSQAIHWHVFDYINKSSLNIWRYVV